MVCRVWLQYKRELMARRRCAIPSWVAIPGSDKQLHKAVIMTALPALAALSDMLIRARCTKKKQPARTASAGGFMPSN